MTAERSIELDVEDARLIARASVAASSTKSYLGAPTIFSGLATSTKKSRAKNKRERLNKKKGRKSS